jgi:hypothetical protein
VRKKHGRSVPLHPAEKVFWFQPCCCLIKIKYLNKSR